MRKSEQSTGSRLLKAGVAVAATAAVVAGVASPAMAATVAMTLSSANGPSATANTITGTTATNVFATTTTYYTTFQFVGTGTAATCSLTYVAPVAIAVTGNVQSAGIVAATSTKVLSAKKVAITQPVSLALGGTQTSAKYNICVYSGNTPASNGVTGSPLVANAAYTISAKATVTGVSPSSGPALGGSTITVTGTNFPATGMTATLGGTLLTGISVNAAGTSFTATVPAHAAGGPFTLSVTTAGGTTNSANAFSYTNGIVISPNTAPNTDASVDIDVLGVGFSNLTFPTAKVYLVEGVYDGIDDGQGAKTNAEIAECGSVLPVSDGEIICTLDLTGGGNNAVDEGTYTLTVVSAGTTWANQAAVPDAYFQTKLSSGSTFTVSDY